MSLTENLIRVTGKDYLSHSAISAYSRCSEQFRLERIEKIPTTGSWAMFGGKVFHTASEYLDKAQVLTVQRAVEDAWAHEEKHSASLDSLRPGGRGKVENGDWWRDFLPTALQRYADWVQGRLDAGWDWLQVGGKPGIEFSVRGQIGGVPALGYVDRAMVSPDGQVFLIDLKTGKSRSQEQLDVYAHLMWQTYQIMPSFTQIFDGRKAEITETWPVRDESRLAGWWAPVADGISSELFAPSPSPQVCSWCDVKPYCRLNGNPDLINSTVTSESE